MSKLLKKLKPGTRVIDIRTGDEGWVTHHTSLPVTVEFFVDNPTIIDGVDCSVRAITYPISDIENRIKLAPKFGNYKVGDRVRDIYQNIEGIVWHIDNKNENYPIVVKFNREDYCSYYSQKGNKLINYHTGEHSGIPVLKKLKVKQ